MLHPACGYNRVSSLCILLLHCILQAYVQVNCLTA
jgi:hypothetical protein